MTDKIPDGSYAVPLYGGDGKLIGHNTYHKQGSRIKSSLIDLRGRIIDVFKSVDVVFTHEELLAAQSNANQQTHLNEIAEDPEKYAISFGLLTGRCGVCHRRLKNPESRERGIGPVCLEKLRSREP